MSRSTKVAVWIIAASLALIATVTVIVPFVVGTQSADSAQETFNAVASEMEAEDVFARVANEL